MTSRRLICVGCSVGGLSAMQTLLSALPASSSIPMAMVQHREAGADDTLRNILQRFSARPVREAEDKEAIAPGTVYIAPADYHLLIDAGHFALSTEGPVSYSRPSVDVLFESAAEAYGPFLIAVILTGANRDGALGMTRVKAHGGTTIVQDPADAENASMPRAAIDATRIDHVLPLKDIGPLLARMG